MIRFINSTRKHNWLTDVCIIIDLNKVLGNSEILM